MLLIKQAPRAGREARLNSDDEMLTEFAVGVTTNYFLTERFLRFDKFRNLFLYLRSSYYVEELYF